MRELLADVVPHLLGVDQHSVQVEDHRLDHSGEATGSRSRTHYGTGCRQIEELEHALKKKTPAEMQRPKITKPATRTRIRLEHSLAADEEISTFLPDTLEEFDAAYANGELKQLRAGLNDALGAPDAAGDSQA